MATASSSSILTLIPVTPDNVVRPVKESARYPLKRSTVSIGYQVHPAQARLAELQQKNALKGKISPLPLRQQTGEVNVFALGQLHRLRE
jgi:hypothetical protein